MNPKEKNKKKGDEGEDLVYRLLESLNYVTEIHPRTFRLIHVSKTKIIQVSQDNDYHSCFDLKAERQDHMIYAQVKWYKTGKIDHGNIAKAKEKIDKFYPHEFPYQKLQVWMVWKEWVKEEGQRRHKDYRFRIWERHGFIEVNKKGFHTFIGNWEEIGYESIRQTEIKEVKKWN